MADAPTTITGVDLALGLVNTIDQLNTPPDFLTDHSRLQRFFVWAGYPQAAEHSRPEDLAEVVSLRDRLTAALDSDAAAAAAILNSVLSGSDAAPWLLETDAGWSIRHGPDPDRGPAFLAAATAVPLMQLLASGDWGRLGRCAASPCCCVYIDRSHNRSRRYCCQLCADRFSQAAARRRRRNTRP
jgi:predicted RNA-binding Zn ribbon-like protein